MTLVSVITPSLNQGQFLQQAMESVLGQDHADLEYIVVDGGSSDDSLDIVRRHADRLAWWVSEPDAGQADAINKGMAHARGEIVGWLNSDDYYLPGAISAAVKVLEKHPEAVLAYGDMQAVDADGRLINLLQYHQISLEDLLCFQIIGQPAAFFRRRSFNAVGGLDTRFHLLLDHHLWIRLALRGPMIYSGQTWAAARHHPGAKNVAAASRFGHEAFEILGWAEGSPETASVLRSLGHRARASAHRVDARYMLDAGVPTRALCAWSKAFALHPASALARLNILTAALLELVGLGALRRAILQQRARTLSK